jgi:hypothetical protein
MFALFDSVKSNKIWEKYCLIHWKLWSVLDEARGEDAHRPTMITTAKKSGRHDEHAKLLRPPRDVTVTTVMKMITR